ncbi:MAG: site-2 protease family protein [Clostridia bacterium]|nr:site-2 protease family protein [Clostridia bacterium]
MDILSIIVAVLLFGIIVLIHEWGHFFVAKRCGIRVNEFALGMGPKLLQFGKGETKYSLRLFPIGGYCAMEGEDEDSNDPRAFSKQKVWKRLLVVVAGAVMNFVLGFAVLVTALSVCIRKDAGMDYALYSTTQIAQLAEDASSYKTGLRPGDTIVAVDGAPIFSDFDLMYLMQTDDDGVFDLTVRRESDGKQKKVELTGVTFPYGEDEHGSYLKYEFKVVGEKKTVWTTVKRAAKLEVSYGALVWRSLGGIVTGQYKLNDLSGPVGTVGVIGDAVEGAVSDAEQGNLDGLYSLLMLVVLITVNVGVFNLLPLPALDGGRLLFLLIEAVTRRKVPAKFEGMVHVVGMVLLLGLMLLVTFSDIVKLFA